MKSFWGAVAATAGAFLQVSHAGSFSSINDINFMIDDLVPRDTASTFEVPLITKVLPGGNTPLVNVSIGTPTQTYTALLDTGSDALWAPDLTSSACQQPINLSLCSQSATNSPLYLGGIDPTKSSTLQPLTNMSLFNITYADSSSENGSYFSDTVTFGQKSFNDIGFGLVTNSTTPYPNFGTWGVGGPRGQGNYPEVLSKIVSAGATACNMFSVWMNGFGKCDLLGTLRPTQKHSECSPDTQSPTFSTPLEGFMLPTIPS